MKYVSLVLAVLITACGFPGSKFPGAFAKDEAECRNVARLVSVGCFRNGDGLAIALACRSNTGNAFDDCMVSKGYYLE